MTSIDKPIKIFTLLKYKIMKSKLNLITAALISVLFSSNSIHAQSMGISSEAITPDPSSNTRNENNR